MNVISPDISILQVQVVFDLSGPIPVVNLTNLSVGSNLPGITWWFVLTSPTGTPIHEGSLAVPDAQGAWSNFSITDPWPMPFGQLEWSGAPYNLTVYIQDSQGNQFSDSSYNASICRPAGNTPKSKNYFGISWTEVQVQCNQASIFFQDQTNASYKGLSGTRLSSVLKVVYPIDDTGNIPSTLTVTNFSAASAPISYSSKNYQFQSQVVYQYELTSNVLVNIRYQTLDRGSNMPYMTFGVYCNIDFLPLICEFEKLVDSIERGTCSDVEDAQRKLTLINPKMSMAVIGVMQPLTGVDVSSLIEDIQRIGGFQCDCLNAPTGVVPNTSGSIGDYTFSVVPQGGDINGSVNVVGTNVQILLYDKSYIFALAPEIPTTAFTITPSTNGYVKTYTLNVNVTQLATDLLTTIAGNPTLVNLFNSLVAGSNTNLQLAVDGKCIFTNTSTFNYTFTFTNIPSSGPNALLTGINVGGVPKALSFAFNLTNLPALQSYLNALGIGSFVVTNPSGQNVQIVSNANPANLSALGYSISSTNYIANQATASAGYQSISANQVVQNIINYLCGITDAQMITSTEYMIDYIGPEGPASIMVPQGTSLTSFLQTLMNLLGTTVDNTSAAVQISCTNIQANFPVSPKPIQATDYILMTKSGACAQGNLLDIFTFMLTQGMTNTTVQQAFCAFVEQCGSGLTCVPYDFANAIVTTYNQACAQIVGIVFSLS